VQIVLEGSLCAEKRRGIRKNRRDNNNRGGGGGRKGEGSVLLRLQEVEVDDRLGYQQAVEQGRQKGGGELFPYRAKKKRKPGKEAQVKSKSSELTFTVKKGEKRQSSLVDSQKGG